MRILNAKNPAVAAITIDPFLIDILSPSSNPIFKAPTPLEATPALEVGALNNHVITHQNTRYVLEATEYVISYQTTSEVPVGGKFVFTFPDRRIWKSSTGTLTATTGASFGTTVADVTATWDSTNTWLTSVTLNGLCTTP